MKRIVLTAAVLAAAAFGSIGAASAQGVAVDPDGVYVGSSYHHRHHWRHDYDYARCRTVVTTHWHHGHRVTVRRRICD